MSDEWCCRLGALAMFACGTFLPALNDAQRGATYTMAVVLVCAAMILKAVAKIGKTAGSEASAEAKP